VRRPAPFVLCFENHAKDGKVWALKTRGRWSRWATVRVSVPIDSTYRGKEARQPKAYFTGRGLVNRFGRHVEIVSAGRTL